MSEINNQGRILNWKRGPEDVRDFKSVRHLAAPLELPTEFELDRKIPIENQLNIGSCVANSACSCFRYEVAQLTNNFDFNPSRLFEYYNARAIQGWENEDSGTFIRDGFKAMNKCGLAKESLWPYKTEDFAKKPTDAAYQDGLKSTTVKYAAVEQTEQRIKETLISGAAISFGFNVYDSFFGSWANTHGIMPIPKKSEYLQGGHAVLICGFSDSMKCFKIQNSWGTEWGIGGYFWMPYSFLLNKDECDDFWCIESIKIEGQDPVNPNPSEINWEIASKILFKTAKELYAVKKPTILRLGAALGVAVDSKKTFNFNYELVKAKLGL